MALIPVCSERHIINPLRRSAHQVTYVLESSILRALNDEFVMHVTYDAAVFQGFHGISQNITAYCLNDVFHKLRTVALNSAPFLSSINSHIGDALSTKLVNAHSWLNIG